MNRAKKLDKKEKKNFDDEKKNRKGKKSDDRKIHQAIESEASQSYPNHFFVIYSAPNGILHT